MSDSLEILERQILELYHFFYGKRAKILMDKLVNDNKFIKYRVATLKKHFLVINQDVQVSDFKDFHKGFYLSKAYKSNYKIARLAMLKNFKDNKYFLERCLDMKYLILHYISSTSRISRVSGVQNV